MQLRYQYRVYPTPGQQDKLARAFGCARVVFNDALRARQDAHTSGVQLSDTDVQRQVVTEAERTERRAWLSGVPPAVTTAGRRGGLRRTATVWPSPGSSLVARTVTEALI